MKRVMIFSFIFLNIVPSFSTLSAPTMGVDVEHAGTYGDGTLYIKVSQTIPETGCESNIIKIPESHSKFDTIASLAITALIAKTTLVVHTNGCFQESATIDESAGSWIFLSRS